MSSQNTTDSDVSQPSVSLRDVSLWINMFAVIDLTALVLSVMTLIAAYFSTVKRQGTWYNFMFSIFVCTASYSLLVFAGQLYRPLPSYTICVIQSALTYASPPNVGSATFGLLVQLYLNIEGAIAGRSQSPREKYWVMAILIIPWIVFFSIFFLTLVSALNDQGSTFTSISYVTLNNHLPGRVTAAIFVLLTIPSLILLVLINKRLRESSASAQAARQYRSMFIRTTIFFVLGLVATATGVIFFFIVYTPGEHTRWYAICNILLVAIPFIAIMIFGSQCDLVVFWLPWRWCMKIQRSRRVARYQIEREEALRIFSSRRGRTTSITVSTRNPDANGRSDISTASRRKSVVLDISKKAGTTWVDEQSDKSVA